MNLILFILKNSRRMMVLAVVVGILSGLSNVGLIFLIHGVIMREQTHPAVMIWSFFGLVLLAAVAKTGSQSLLIALSRKSIARLSMHLSRRILATPLRQLETMGQSRLMAILTGDIPMIAQGLNAIPTLCVNVAMIVACLGYLCWLSPLVFSSVLGLLLVGLLVQRLLTLKAMRSLRQAREEHDSLMGNYRGLIEGIKELKIHQERREAFMSQNLRATVDSLEKQNTSGQLMLSFASSGARFFFFGLMGLLIFVPPHWAEISRPTLSGYILVLMFLMAPVQSLGPMIPTLARATVALGKVEALGHSLAAARHLGQWRQAPRLGPAWQSLELAGVSHAYHHERDGSGFTLGPLDLSFRPGELVFLVGGNGSGKTTFAKLLIGLYRPETGEIRLDDQPITETNRESYCQLFSVVFADFFLFERLLGLGTAEVDERAREFLAGLHLDHKVTVKNGKLSTTRLSKGQRKRLALLTAYLEDRPIYVFDEWASDQDPNYKMVFYTQILPRLKAKGKLVLVITHDEKYYHLADRILHLDEGQLVIPGENQAPVAAGPAAADLPNQETAGPVSVPTINGEQGAPDQAPGHPHEEAPVAQVPAEPTSAGDASG